MQNCGLVSMYVEPPGVYKGYAIAQRLSHRELPLADNWPQALRRHRSQEGLARLLHSPEMSETAKHDPICRRSRACILWSLHGSSTRMRTCSEDQQFNDVVIIVVRDSIR